MSDLPGVIVSNAVAAVVLAVLAALVGLVCRRPALLHALWLLVLLKLVTPPLVRVPVPWPTPAAEVALSSEAAPPTFAEEPALPEEPARDAEVEPPDWANEDVAVVEEAPAVAVPEVAADEPLPASPAPPEWPLLPLLLGGAWVSGSLGWFLLAGLRVRRFQQALRDAQPAPEALRRRVAEWSERLGLSRAPGTWLVPGQVAPMVWAVGGRARLLLPADLLDKLDDQAVDTLLLHELAHLKRRDHWVRSLEMLVLGLYWWHPVVWYARRELREAEEQCCDAWVVAMLPEAGRTYATALLDTLDFLSQARCAVPPLASGLGKVADLKRRLTMIMRGKTPRALSWPGCLAVLALAMVLPLVPSWVSAQDTKEEPKLQLRFRAQGVRAGGETDDLARQEAELVKKLAEVKAARARLEKERAEKTARLQLEVARGRLEGTLRDLQKIEIAKGTIVIRIEISGAKAADIEAIIQGLKKGLPVDGKRIVIVREPEKVGGGGPVPGQKLLWTVKPHPPGAPGAPQPPIITAQSL